MAKVDIYNQKFLPTTETSQSHSLPGEKRSPIYRPDQNKTWEAMSNLAQQVTRFDAKLQEARAVEKFEDIKNNTKSFYDDLTNEMQTPEYRQQHSYSEDTDYFDKLSEEYINKTLDKLDVDKRYYPKIEGYLNEQHLKYRTRAVAISRQSEISSMRDKLYSSEQSSIDRALRLDMQGDTKSVMEEISDRISYIHAKVADQTITADTGTNLINSYIRKIQIPRYERKIVLDPKAAYEELSKPSEYLPENLRIDLQLRAKEYIDRLENKKQRENYTNIYIAKKAIDDSISSIITTGKEVPGVEDKIKIAYGENEKSKALIMEYNDNKLLARDRYNKLSKIKQIPITEAKEYLDSIKPKGGTSDFKYKQETYSYALALQAKKEDQLRKDPAAFVVSNGVNHIPIKEDMTAEQVQAATNINIENRMAEQKRQGVPDYNIRILTNNEADSIVQKLNASSVDDQVKMLRLLEIQYGDKWYKVEKELEDHKLPKGLSLSIRVKDPNMSHIFIVANRITDKELKDAIGEEYNNTRKLVDEEIRDRMAEYRIANQLAVRSSVINIDKSTDTTKAMTKAALVLSHHENIDVDDAIDKVVDSVIGGYVFKSTYFIPREFAPYEDKIEFVLDKKLKSLKDSDLFKAYNSKEFVEDFKDGGYWVVNRKEGLDFGYVLLYKMPNDRVIYVKDKDNKPIEVTMHDIINLDDDEYNESAHANKTGNEIVDMYIKNFNDIQNKSDKKKAKELYDVFKNSPYYELYKSRSKEYSK